MRTVPCSIKREGVALKTSSTYFSIFPKTQIPMLLRKTYMGLPSVFFHKQLVAKPCTQLMLYV